MVRKQPRILNILHLKRFNAIFNLSDKILSELDEYMDTGEAAEEAIKRWERMSGKGSVIAMLEKVVNILKHIIPMESEIMDTLKRNQGKELRELSEEDKLIIQRYLQKVREATTEVENIEVEKEESKV